MITQKINKFPTFNETPRFITVSTRTHQLSLLVCSTQQTHFTCNILFKVSYILIFSTIRSVLSIFSPFWIFKFTIYTFVIHAQRIQSSLISHPNMVKLFTTNFCHLLISPHHFLFEQLQCISPLTVKS